MATTAITSLATGNPSIHRRPSSAPANLARGPLGNMLTYLEADDALNCDKVCRRWHAGVTGNPLVWKVYCERVYPDTALEVLNDNPDNQINWRREYLLQRATDRNIARRAFATGFRFYFPSNANPDWSYVGDNFVCYEVNRVEDAITQRGMCTDIMFRQLPGNETIKLASISTGIIIAPNGDQYYPVTQMQRPIYAGKVLLIRFASKFESISSTPFDDGVTVKETSLKVAVTQNGIQDWSSHTLCSWDPKTKNFKLFALIPGGNSCLCGTKNALYVGCSDGTLIKFDLSGKHLASFKCDSKITQIVVEQGRVCVASKSKLLIFSEDNITAPLHILDNENEIAHFQVKGNKAFLGGNYYTTDGSLDDISTQIWDIENGKRIAAIAQPGNADNYQLKLHNGLLFNLTRRGWLHIRDVRNLAAIRYITSIKLDKSIVRNVRNYDLFLKKEKIYLGKINGSFVFLNFRPSLHTDAALAKRLSRVVTELVRAPTTAMSAFEALPEVERNRIYGRVWALKGSPMGNPEFGRLSFHRMEGLSAEHHCTQDDRVAVVRQQRNFVQSTLVTTVPANDNQVRILRQGEVESALSSRLVEQLIDIVKTFMPQNTEAEIAGLAEAERNRLYGIVWKLKKSPYGTDDFGQLSFHRSRELPVDMRCTQAERREALRQLAATQTAAAGTAT